MREIKFRFWDDKEKNMDYDVRCPMYGWDECYSMNEAFAYLQKEGWKIMQFTGLYDHKSTSDVYEHDIVKTQDGIGIVAWDKEGCDYNIVRNLGLPHEGNNFICALGLDGYSYEAIGNIYENPELLNKD